MEKSSSSSSEDREDNDKDGEEVVAETFEAEEPFIGTVVEEEVSSGKLRDVTDHFLRVVPHNDCASICKVKKEAVTWE